MSGPTFAEGDRVTNGRAIGTVITQTGGLVHWRATLSGTITTHAVQLSRVDVNGQPLPVAWTHVGTGKLSHCDKPPAAVNALCGHGRQATGYLPAVLEVGTHVTFDWAVDGVPIGERHGVVVDVATFGGEVRHGVSVTDESHTSYLYDVWPIHNPRIDGQWYRS
jgi:hypothetical protein